MRLFLSILNPTAWLWGFCVMFSLYAALVKNLRGVVVFRECNENVLKRIEWLRKRFRYRDLGLPPSLFDRCGDNLRNYLNGEPFQLLTYPLSKYLDLVKTLATILDLDSFIIEPLILSSLYISPLLIIDERVSEIIIKIGSKTIYTSKRLGIRDWKLHLRIADYTILDAYRETVLNAMSIIDLLQKKDYASIEKLVEKRREIIEKDIKRYWRIMDSSNKPFLTYIDLLISIIENREKIASLDRDWSAGLAIIPAIHIIEVI